MVSKILPAQVAAPLSATAQLDRMRHESGPPSAERFDEFLSDARPPATSIRADLVRKLKHEIETGTYLTDHRIEMTIGRLSDALHGRG